MITIQVTAEDIKAGQPHRVFACPVARAIGRYLGRSVAVRVWDGKAYLDGYYPPRLPRRVGEFIYAFDRGLPVVPFKFRFREP